MRRNIFNATASRAVCRAFAGQPQPRRSFASAAYFVPAGEQAHPVGPFYEAVLRTPQGPMPAVKPEEPPVTSQESPKPAPEEKNQASESTPQPPAEEKQQPAAEKPAAQEEKPKPVRRPRKPRQPKEESANGKAKSVPPSCSPSSSLPIIPSDPNQPPPETPSNKQIEPQARPSVIFSSSLAGPAERAERLARIRTESRLVAGVLVPPKPEEPDNCCMSGCVNCVWDRYRDEMEDWAAKSAEAERRLAAREVGGQVGVTEESMDAVTRREGEGDEGLEREGLDRGLMGMDDDGGGSAGNWVPDSKGKAGKEFWDDELYKNVPVGIREFMKQEKRLKEKHMREGTMGG